VKNDEIILVLKLTKQTLACEWKEVKNKMRRLQKALLSLLSTIIVATSIPIVISSCSPYPDFSTDKMVFVDNDEQMMSIEFNQHGGTYEILLRILDNKATTIEITASMSSQGIVSINQGAT
jgi:hypothetical protein